MDYWYYNEKLEIIDTRDEGELLSELAKKTIPQLYRQRLFSEGQKGTVGYGRHKMAGDLARMELENREAKRRQDFEDKLAMKTTRITAAATLIATIVGLVLGAWLF